VPTDDATGALGPVFDLDHLSLDALRERIRGLEPWVEWLRSHDATPWPCWHCHRRQVRLLALLQATWADAAKPGPALDWWRYALDHVETRYWAHDCQHKHRIAVPTGDAGPDGPGMHDGWKRGHVPALDDWLASAEFAEQWRRGAAA